MSNRHLERAWIYYYKALDDWIDCKYEFAISDYAKAYEKVNEFKALGLVKDGIY